MFSFYTGTRNTNVGPSVYATSSWPIFTAVKSSQSWEYISSRARREHRLSMQKALGSINLTTAKPYLKEATLSTNNVLDDTDSNSLDFLTFLVDLYTLDVLA